MEHEHEQLYLPDLKAGDQFSSPSVTVTDSHFMFFKAMTGDSHPIHYDDHYVQQTPAKKRLTHGLLLASMGALGASSVSPKLEESMIAFLEQSSRFVKPVFIGDTVKTYFTVEHTDDKGERGILTVRLDMRNQNGETVMEGRHKYMLKSKRSGM